VLASLLIAAGVGGPIYIASRISAGVREQVVVDSPNAASFALWADNRGADAPAMFYEWRFFNVVNADDYEAGRDAHLRLDEVGPYVYREFVVRSEDLVFSADRTKAEYTYWEFYQFDRNRTAPHLDPYADRLTLVNVPLLSVLKILAPDDSPAVDRWWQMLVFDLIASATNASLFVRDLAPNASAYGYTDPTLVFLRRLVPDLIPFVDHGLQVNDSSPAAAKARNQSMGTYTGADDLAKAGSTFMFNNYEQHLDCWATADANRIVGCDGFQCAPDIALGDQRLFWLPPLYRPLSLTTNETYTLEGVEVNRFYVDPDNFFNASLKPANAGFYMFGPSGVGNLTADPELAGAPVYISNPRFYLADPRYTESIVLAQCDPARRAESHRRRRVQHHRHVPRPAQSRVVGRPRAAQRPAVRRRQAAPGERAGARQRAALLAALGRQLHAGGVDHRERPNHRGARAEVSRRGLRRAARQHAASMGRLHSRWIVVYCRRNIDFGRLDAARQNQRLLAADRKSLIVVAVSARPLLVFDSLVNAGLNERAIGVAQLRKGVAVANRSGRRSDARDLALNRRLLGR
jgi:hypothetical protein